MRNMPRSETSTPIMFYYVYVLQSIKNSNLYIGYTTKLAKRLQEHNRGLNFSTKPYRPWVLIHFEGYRNYKDARRREKYLKTSQGGRLLKRMLKEYFYSRRK
jgi:putative endonuclease